jgi:excisionase family DNA binding protein
MTELLTLDQVAERLQVSRKTVNREVARGHLRVRYFGQSPRVTDRELEAYIASRPTRRVAQ